MTLRRMPALLASVLVLFNFCVLHPCAAESDSGRRLTLLESRPCGPDCFKGPLRFFFPQGCAGADFRDACRRHDACYDLIGSCRETCDLVFLEDLLEECGNSRFPMRARFRARLSYFAVKHAGRPAWISAQQLACRKAGVEFVAPEPPARPFSRWFPFQGKAPKVAK